MVSPHETRHVIRWGIHDLAKPDWSLWCAGQQGRLRHAIRKCKFVSLPLSWSGANWWVCLLDPFIARRKKLVKCLRLTTTT